MTKPLSAVHQAEADAVAGAIALMFEHHPYQALHEALPILLTTSHQSIRRFAWKFVESLVVRMVKYNLPEQRHVDSFARIYQRYRDEAEALGDIEVVVLMERGIAGVHINDPATPPQTGLSVARITATLEASEVEYTATLASSLLGGREFLEDAFVLVQTSPVEKARAAGLTLIGVTVSRLETMAGRVTPSQRQNRLPVFQHWRAELADDPEAAALCDRAIAALEPQNPES